MSEKKSYNVSGEDDMEFVEMFQLDPALAYTPAVNNAILDAIHEKNTGYYMDQGGMSEAEATRHADAHRSQGAATVKSITEKRGY